MITIIENISMNNKSLDTLYFNGINFKNDGLVLLSNVE